MSKNRNKNRKQRLTENEKKLRKAMVKDIMDDFDFVKIHKVMKALNWEWRDEGVPNLYSIMKTAEELLIDAFTRKGTMSTGGFTASMIEDTLSLSFNLEQGEAYASDHPEYYDEPPF